jgi:hypothetical protein
VIDASTTFSGVPVSEAIAFAEQTGVEKVSALRHIWVGKRRSLETKWIEPLGSCAI